jgi:protein TonB
VKSDAAFSWKGLTLSAALHGAAFAAVGLVLLKPAQVGTREAPVTAELEVLSDVAPTPSLATAEPSERDSKVIPEIHDEMPVPDRLEEMTQKQSQEEPPVETALPVAVAKEQSLADPIPAANIPAAHVPSASRPAHRSVPHPAAVVQRGARNVQPDYLNNSPPQYPESSRLSGEQGVVLVRAGVATTGQVTRVELARSSGHSALDRAAVEAVGGWKFRPASAAGIAMTSEVIVPVRFELHEGKSGTIRNP